MSNPGRHARLAPTPEQQAIRNDAAARPYEGRKCVAFAGTGKTSTLEMLAEDRPEPGIYLAFNRSIKQEASRRFPRHIKVTTAHAAAYAALAMHEQKERLSRRLFADGVSRLVRLPHCRMPEVALGQVVLDTVARFCNSADRELGLAHVALDPREPEDVRLAALAGAQALWQRMADRRDQCPITHDVYLKLWQLGDAGLRGYGWAMFDEAQDASPVMVDIMVRQGIPITWIGDPHQQIYAFRGAVNAMRTMPGHSFPLTRSFRFGEPIAALANAVLACKPDGLRPTERILGNTERESQVGRMPKGATHAFLSRTNAEWFEHALSVSCRVHVIGGIDETERLLLAAWGLWRYNARPDRCPAIARFATWSQLCEHAERFDDRELTFARRIVEQWQEGLPGAVAGLRARHVEHEADAELVLSTAHKAKGREFGYVRLGNGFPSPLDEGWLEMTPQDRGAELNLLYVALTRAMFGLQPCAAVLDCVALASGSAEAGRPRPPQRLPLIKLASTTAPEVQAPPRAARPVPAKSAEARPEDTLSATSPCSARGSIAHLASVQGSPSLCAATPAEPWSADEDREALRMSGEAFPIEDIAAWLSRPAPAVALRLAVLGAPGADASLPAEALAALAAIGDRLGRAGG